MATRRSWRNASRGAAAKSYVVGLQRISIDDGADLHCYGYDAHNGVRLLIDGSGNVTDAWDYDAFGNVVARTGTIANDFTYRMNRWRQSGVAFSDRAVVC